MRAEEYRNAWQRKTTSVDVQDARLAQVQDITPKSKRYTLMVYMIGSNLESTIAAGTHDLEEMRSSGVDFEKVNVVVYAGGTKRWNSAIPANHNSVLDLSLPEDDCIVAQTESSVSMGCSETLTSFVDYCHDKYPAEHSALVLWDHGGGPLWGYGSDEAHDGDGLLFSELREAMAKSAYGAKDAEKLDWVGFDACLMGSLENCVLWHDYAKVLVASEEVEPGDGWDYSFLGTMNETDDASSIARAVLSGYETHYKEAASEYSNPDVTLAAYDLEKVDAATKALDVLSEALDGDVASGGYAAINRSRGKTKSFGLAAAGTRAEAYDLVDIVDLATQLEDAHPKECKSLQKAIDVLLIDSVQNIERAHGLSLYFPGENRELFETLGPASIDAGRTNSSDAADIGADVTDGFAISSVYSDFVGHYTDAWLDASDVDWNLPEPEVSDDGVSIKLSDAQFGALSSANYTVLEVTDDNAYFVRTSELRAEIGEDGTLHAPSNPPVLTSKTDLGNAMPEYCMCIEQNDDEAKYVCDALYLASVGDFNDFDVAVDPHVSVALGVASGDKGVSIEAVTSADNSVGTGGKNTIDVNDYSGLILTEYNGGELSPSFDTSGNVLPWNEWDRRGYIWRYSPLEQGFGFVMCPASDFYETVGIQIVVTDVNGVRHAAKPVKARTGGITGEQPHEKTVKTELGTLTYEIMDDHAEVKKYEGDDYTVEIESSVEGVPVTAIGNYAFYGSMYLDTLELPKGIETIGSRAFAHSGLYSITLPSTLRHVVKGAFAEIDNLREFVLSGKNSYVSVKDGVLFSADGSTLIAYPNAKGDAYAVPEGTKTVGYGSFAHTSVKNITFPEGLVCIDRAAFYGCENLGEIKLPKSLERIGSCAFDVLFLNTFGGEAHADPTRLAIGPNVEYIGEHALRGLCLTGIDVDPANKRYKSGGNCLLNAAGDAVLQAPRALGDLIEIPEGVVSLGPFAFSDYDGNTEFILPSTLESIDATSLPRTYDLDNLADDGSYVAAYECTIHAEEGSYAWRFAEENGIAHDAVVDRGALVHEVKAVSQGDLIMAFKVYDNRAVLVSAGSNLNSDSPRMSNQHELTIPAEVDGKPVEVIDLDLLFKLSLGDESESNERISLYADDVESLTLPASLKEVSARALVDFGALKHLSLDGASESFSVVDDVLFTADGTKLVAYPAGVGGSYVVPEGVEEIGSYAFSGARELKDVELASSVEVIGEKAFSGCGSLEHVSFAEGIERIPERCFEYCDALVLDAPLPENLVEIGVYAFHGIASCKGMVIPDGIERIGKCAFGTTGEKLLEVPDSTLHIGPYLEHIDTDALGNLGYTGFEVDEDNEVYKADGPFLLFNQDLEICGFAAGSTGEVRVPDGIRTFDFGLLDSARRVTDLYIPASVEVFAREWFVTDGEGAYATMTIHVQKGSYGEEFANEKGLSWVVE